LLVAKTRPKATPALRNESRNAGIHESALPDRGVTATPSVRENAQTPIVKIQAIQAMEPCEAIPATRRATTMMTGPRKRNHQAAMARLVVLATVGNTSVAPGDGGPLF